MVSFDDPKGGRFISKTDEEVKADSQKKREKKLNIREFDPLKDDSSEIIGGYSIYIKKKKLLAHDN